MKASLASSRRFSSWAPAGSRGLLKIAVVSGTSKSHIDARSTVAPCFAIVSAARRAERRVRRLRGGEMRRRRGSSRARGRGGRRSSRALPQRNGPAYEATGLSCFGGCRWLPFGRDGMGSRDDSRPGDRAGGRSSRPLQGAPCGRAAVRDAQPVGRRLRPAARVVRLRGARDDERRVRVVARQARRAVIPRRAGRTRGRSSRPRRTCRSTSTASAATRTIRAASPRRSRCSPMPGRPASRSRTTTRPPAASTTSRPPPRGSPPPPRRHTACRSRWCSPVGRRTTSAASTTSTTRSRA